MKPLSAGEIQGNWATILLPINSDESIDFSRLRDDLEYLAEAQTDGIYTNGTAGEFYAQTEDEFIRICEITAEICEKYSMPFQLGASFPTSRVMLERVRRAKEFKPSAIQIILPDWISVSLSEAVGFLRKAAEIASPIGIVLYNPPHAKKILQPSDFGSLKKEVPNIVGVKVMDGDENWYLEMNEFARDISVFVPGHHLATGYSRGASGSYSNVACLNPKGAQKWFELIKTDIAAAIESEKRIQSFLSEFILPFRVKHNYCNAAIDKFLAAIGGWGNAGTRLRFPYLGIPETEVAEIRRIAKSLLPELFTD